MRGSYFVWLVLAGCPAEQLGIPVPARGVGAVQMEDIVRDVTKLSRGDAAKATPSGEAARMGFLDDRWRQMGLEPQEGGRCGLRAGTGGERVAVVAEPGTPGDPLSQAPTAVAITVAKALHGRPVDEEEVWFCVGPPPVEVGWAATIGPLGVGEPVRTVSPAGIDVRGGPGAGEIDYRVVEKAARALVTDVEAQLSR